MEGKGQTGRRGGGKGGGGEDGEGREEGDGRKKIPAFFC